MMEQDGDDASFLRRLSNDTDGFQYETPTPSPTIQVVQETGNEGQALQNSCKVYGSIFLVLFTLFCFLRQRYPRLFNIRSWSPKMKCELAMDQHGFLRWMWELYFVKDDVILQQCGMDALCFLRVLFFGFKLSCVGIFNALWLLPVYATSQGAEMAASKLERLSTSFVPSGSTRFLATVFAAYIIFGFTMYLILKEFRWYTEYRHMFLMQRTPRNYSVYVTGIPDEYRSSYALTDYFRQCFSRAGVLEAHVAMEIPDLEHKVEKRKVVAKKLAHAINLEKMCGITAVHHRVKLFRGEIQKEESISVYQEDLETLNQEIADSIRKIKFVNNRMQKSFEKTRATRSGLSVDDGLESPKSITNASGKTMSTAGASNWQSTRNFNPLKEPEHDVGVRRRLNSDIFDASGEDVGCHRRRLSSDIFDIGVRQRMSSDMFDIGSSPGSGSERKRMNSNKFDIETGIPTHMNAPPDDIDMEELSIEEKDEYTIPPNTEAPSEDGIFHSDETEQTFPPSEMSASNSDDMDEADAFANIFFGARLTMRPKAPEPAVVKRISPSIVEHDETRELPHGDGEPAGDSEISSSVATIPPSMTDDDEPFNVPVNPTRSTAISEGDCVPQYESSDAPRSDPNELVDLSIPPPPPRFPDGSPLQHQSSSRKSLGLKSVARLPKDVTKVAKRAVIEGSDQVKNFVQDGSSEVFKVVKGSSHQVKRAIKEVNPENLKKAGDLGVKGILKAKDAGVHQILKAKDKGLDNMKNLASFVLGNGDGTPRDAGFVSFTKLSTVNAALQMIHHPRPFVMDVQEAPEPDDIYWRNVGMPHKARQIGKLISIGLATLLCFFWTIPVSFISSLTEVNSLRDSVKFIDNMLEKAPWMQLVLEQLAPLLLVGLNACLPFVLSEISKLEGHIASSALEASLFSKMAAFMIIQTFFVSAISGGIWAELSNILAKPESIIDLLARSLPAQSTYFLQILLVNTFIGQSTELLRVAPLAMAWVRSRVGPNLTEKERDTVYMGLHPLSDPWEFQHAEVFGQATLFFMVLFVYSTMAPITSFFLAFFWLLLGSCYRHQFFYNYTMTPDSGGKLWSSFIGIALFCMIIAQLTLVGLLALKKATLATPLMFPLIAITVLFLLYIRNQHFYVTEHLPTRECLQLDRKRHAEFGRDFSFLEDKYLQPALLEKTVHVDLQVNTTPRSANSSSGHSKKSSKKTFFSSKVSFRV